MNIALVLTVVASAAVAVIASVTILRRTVKVTNGKLDVIHTLVNSSLTSEMQDKLDGLHRELAMMAEVVALKRTLGAEPSVEALAAIESTKARIAELTAGLEDRGIAQEQADREMGGVP